MPLQRFLDDPKLLGRRPAPATATIGDDFNIGHEHMLKPVPKPSLVGLRCPIEMGAGSNSRISLGRQFIPLGHLTICSASICIA